MSTNPIVHFELAGPDEGPLHDFYQGLFGWSVASMGPGYALVETPAGSPNGALREAEDPSLTIGIEVPDLDAAVGRSVDLGGTVVMAPTDNGYVNKALVSDPAGNVVSLIESVKGD